MRIRHLHLLCLCLCLALMAVIAPLSRAESVPPLINYQGRLTDTDSKPVTGTKKLTVNIYDAVSGGNLLWGPQVFPTVPVINGYFNIILGPVETDGSGVALANGDSINTAFTGGVNCYLQVQVDAEPVTVPRQRILSVPYAVQAQVAGAVVEQGVTTAMLGDGAVTPAKIASQAVDASKMLLSYEQRSVSAWDVPGNQVANHVAPLEIEITLSEPRLYLISWMGYYSTYRYPVYSPALPFDSYTYLRVMTYDASNPNLLIFNSLARSPIMLVPLPAGRTVIQYFIVGDWGLDYYSHYVDLGQKITVTLTAAELQVAHQ